MTLKPINNAFPVFRDGDGEPLESGFVYIGSEDNDPVSNPITVYFDPALTLAATQPLRTVAGYVYNNGSPANLYTNTDYSISVRDKNGTEVQNRLSVPASYTDMVSVKDYGALGDGVADDTAAIQAAVAAESYVYFPPGTYNVTQLIFENITTRKTLIGLGDVKINGTGTLNSVIRFGGATSGTNRVRYFTFQDIQITASGTYSYYLELRYITDSVFRNIDAEDLPSFSNVGTFMFIDFSFDNSFYEVFGVAQNGIECGPLSPNRNSFFGGRLSGQNRLGIGISTGGAGNSFFGVDVSLFNEAISGVRGFSGLAIHACYFESNNIDITFGTQAGRGADIAGCVHLQGTGVNVGIQHSGPAATQGVSIHGTQIRDKTNAIILDPLTFSWMILGNDYQNNTTIITHGGQFHTIDNFDGTKAEYSRLDLSLGNTTTRGQIKFPATPITSTDVATLDAYLEQSWTPVPTNLTVVGTATYTGTYTRIGRYVFIRLFIDPDGASTTASTVNSTFFSGAPTSAESGVLPVIDGAITTFGNAVMTGANLFTPTWAASNNQFIISGGYIVAS